MVSGDSLQSRFRVHQGARVLITTPASGKDCIRARKNQIVQTASTHINISSDAFCAHLPQDTIVFDRAYGELGFLTVDSDATFIGWEHLIFGRRAGGYPFESGQHSVSQNHSRSAATVLGRI